MPRFSQSCTSCGWAGDIHARAFENPSCPQCGAATERLWVGEPVSIQRDEIPGGQFFENGWAEPRRFDSHSAHRKALAAEGLEQRVRWAGPNDKHVSRMDIPCAQTLENARILLTRGAQAVRERKDRWPNATLPITVEEGGPFRIKQDHG